MKIEFVRTGGLAGMRLAVDLDTEDLPVEDATQLALLVETARRALTDAPRSQPMPDRYEYQLTIDTPEWGRATYTLSEPDVAEPVRPLIEQLTAIARRSRQ